MGRGKVIFKKVTPARSSVLKEVAASSGSNPAPVQKKRGRPRKVIKEDISVTDTKPDAVSTDLSRKPEKKRSRPKKVEESTELSGNNGEGASSDLIVEPAKPMVTRRLGSRRKSEPRRAAGAFLDCT